MKIEIGKVFPNKTVKYLLPSLKLLGDDFKAKFNLVHVLASGVHDTLMDGTPYEGQRLIYLLLDKLVKPTLFKGFLSWIKLQPYYALDYSFDNFETGRMHMIALSYPEKYADAYDKFILGKYSKMYTKDEVVEFFGANREDAKSVINKSAKSGEKHVINLNLTYNSSITLTDLLHEGGEHDFPPQEEQEVFNFKK
jgi:hypothetical protein